MPNQMIALQARAPQTDVLGASIQRNAQMMNMMSQQRAAERQAAQAAQQMEIARAQEARAAAGEDRAAAKFAIDQDALLYAKYRNMAPAVIESNNPEVYANWLAQLNAELPDRAKMVADAMPPERFNKDAFTLMMATMDQRFEARYGKAITKELIGPTGEMYGANISGVPGASYAVPLPDISRPRSGATPPVAGAAMAPSAGVNARATRGSATTPDDLRAQGVDPRSIPLGNPLMKPMSDTGAPAPDLGAIVQTMMDTGVVSQSNLEAMRAAAGPGKDAQLAEILRSNNIRIMPDEQPAGGMRSAVYRPEEGAADMTQVQYNPNDYEQVRVKSPMQSPLPGSAQVPLGRVRGEAEATEAGKQGVRVEVEPKIAGGTKTAELQAQKDMAFPDAQGQFEAALATIDNRLADIKRFREHPAATRVIGPLDAFTLNFGRARGAQAIYDALVATATLDELMQMRQNSPTGGALGNVSDADIRVLRQSIGALKQDQSEEDFHESLRIFEDRLRQTRERLIRRYKENYGYKLGKNWQPPATSTRRKPAAGGRTVGGFTVMEVED